MTKKDYVRIAGAIRVDNITLRAVAQQLAEALYEDNGRFDHHAFKCASTGVIDLSGKNYRNALCARAAKEA